MRISVFGLGYVGAVSGACLAELGHQVTGVDVDGFKVDSINGGKSPIVEDALDGLISEMVRTKRFTATANIEEAVANTEISFICVGTPSLQDGGLGTRYVERVSRQIGEALALKPDYHLVVVRSTVLAGTTESVVIPVLSEASGKRLGPDFGVCFHPEFLREGSSVQDFRDPPKIVIGGADDKAAKALAVIYEGFEAPVLLTSIPVAEMVKYADNAFHALKVVFGNEIGTLCKSLGVDSHEVMDVFCQDTKLNISPAYLKPGFSYGGSCLPKDLRALLHLARTGHLSLPMLESLRVSNANHTRRALEIVLSSGARSVAMLGLSFKPGTDDLRESPLVELAEQLLGKGVTLKIYDESVMFSRIRGGNKAYVEERLPHISLLLVSDIEEAMVDADAVIVGAKNDAFAQAIREHGRGKSIVDLSRLYEAPPEGIGSYHGICW